MNTDSRSPGDDVDGAAALPEHVPTGPLWAELRDAIRGTGVMRHADAGYEIARLCAKEQGLKLPMV